MRYLLILALLMGCGEDKDASGDTSTVVTNDQDDKKELPIEEDREPEKPNTEEKTVTESEPLVQLPEWYITEEQAEEIQECDEGYQPLEFDEDILEEIKATEKPVKMYAIYVGEEIYRYEDERDRWASTGWWANNGHPDIWDDKLAYTVCRRVET